ncbi:hypothetical protein GH733_013848 [Mirounga leonina]|nr:hypothetical protein GH733_013848 [Mirounga leonina]
MGISPDKTGDERKPYHEKWKFELGSLTANTKIGPHSNTHRSPEEVPCLEAEHGGPALDSEGCKYKTRVTNVVYNASNNELVCTSEELFRAHWQRPAPTVVGAPLCTVPGLQEGGQTDCLGKQRNKTKNNQRNKQTKKPIKQNSEEMMKGKRMAKSAVFWSVPSRASFSCASLQEQMAPCSRARS